ncbi:MAG: hypothetical protein BGO09_16620 [Bacteroidetes bacterium 47-18]|nr:MAG: hypothetical protein BGO09_16620 [Bacteroidetes bacterium 47-18]
MVNPKHIMIEMEFSEQQFLKLRKGFIPLQMEDKWFIYYDNEWLYFHRSWTGKGIYKTQINQKPGNCYFINSVWVERDKDNYENEDDNFDIDIFKFLVNKILLR